MAVEGLSREILQRDSPERFSRKILEESWARNGNREWNYHNGDEMAVVEGQRSVASHDERLRFLENVQVLRVVRHHLQPRKKNTPNKSSVIHFLFPCPRHCHHHHLIILPNVKVSHQLWRHGRFMADHGRPFDGVLIHRWLPAALQHRTAIISGH